jgi:glycosyltransferase involved in cell wall biosynthesis
MRAVVVSEHMGPPLDEGIRKFATCLVSGLSSHVEACGIAAGSPYPRPLSRSGGREEMITDDERILHAPGGRLFRGRALRYTLRAIDPDLIVYVPSASGTLFSFLRARGLQYICPDAHVSMVLPQMRRHTAPVRRLLSRLTPDSVFCQSAGTAGYLASLGVDSRFLPSGVDLRTFQPLSPSLKMHLRFKYCLPAKEYLVLHTGHLTPGRNTRVLGKLEGVGRAVMLAGRSAGRDPRIKRKLEQQGVIVIDTYVERVEELYQAVDCYMFPVREEDAAMEFPLSVLEAMACDLPVIAYPYGGLPLALEPRDGLVFAENDDALLEAVGDSKQIQSNTRAQAQAFDWPRVAATILEAAEVRNAGAIVAAV